MIPALQSLLSAEVLVPLVVFAALALAGAVLFRKERRLLAGLAILLGVSLVLRAAGAGLAELGLPAAARTTTFLALLLQGIGFVNLGAIVLFDVFVPAVRLSPPRLLRDLLTAFAYVVLALGLFAREHVDVSGIVATSAVLTAVIGLSLQDSLANVMGGVAVQLDRSIRPGDWIRVGDHAGRVLEIGWRRTTLEARNGDGLVVPNSLLVKSAVVVEGRSGETPPLQRRSVTVGLGYGVRPEEAIAVLEEALRADPPAHVSAVPPPDVVLLGLKEWEIEYGIRYWLKEPARSDVADSAVRVRALHALRRAGFEPALPLHSHLVEREDGERRARRAEEEVAARVAALSAAAVFGALTPAELRGLADHLVAAPYAPGEPIVRQGEEGRDLFVLARGGVDVLFRVPWAAPRIVASLEAPDVFGEMGPLAGEPRRATVVAGARGASCWRLGMEPLKELFAARPQLADEMSQELARREVRLAAAREGLSEEATRGRLAAEGSSLSGRIRNFFGLD